MPLYPAKPEADQSLVQARRTTAFTLSTAFADVDLDTTDIENDTEVIEHTDPDRVLIKVAGKYGISFATTGPAPVSIGSDITTYLRVRKNDATVLPGSERFTVNEDNISAYFVAQVESGDYISLQAAVDSGTPDLPAGLSFSVIHLAGQKGDPGAASATDINAIHDNVAGEIALIAAKTTPADTDYLLIEDSENSDNKKRLQIGNLPGGAPLADTAPVNVTKAAASAGTATSASRQDHKHDVTTAAPPAGAVAAGNIVGEGSATSLARSDHQHAVTVASPSSVGTANAAGSAGTFVRSDHVHAGLTRGAADFDTFGAKATPAASDLFLLEDSDAALTKKKVTASSLILAGLSDVVPGDVTKAAASAGTAVLASRQDHKHDVSTAAPTGTGVATASAEGTATSLARSDHAHQSNTAPVNVTKAAAAIGTSGEPARADHKHDVTTATTAAGSVAVGNTAAEGTATSLSRSDHQHAVTAATPVSVGTANAAGAATTFPRSDHVHSGLTRGAADFDTFTAKTTPADADLVLIEDSAAGLAKKKISLVNLLTGSLNYANQVLITGDTTSTATTYTLISGLTITPAAGTYLVSLSGTIKSTIKSRTMYLAIFVGGTIVSGSERQYSPGETDSPTPFALPLAISVTVNGAQAVEARWMVTAGSPAATMTINNRNLTLFKVV